MAKKPAYTIKLIKRGIPIELFAFEREDAFAIAKELLETSKYENVSIWLKDSMIAFGNDGTDRELVVDDWLST